MSGNVRRRLLDLGLVKGACIEPVFSSPFANPIAYEIRGSIVAIRNDDAKLITVTFD